jgi:hypothetical protein
MRLLQSQKCFGSWVPSGSSGELAAARPKRELSAEVVPAFGTPETFSAGAYKPPMQRGPDKKSASQADYSGICNVETDCGCGSNG